MFKIFFLLLTFPFIIHAQENEKNYYDIAEIPIKPKGFFRLDSLSYTIVDVVDQQNNNSVLGEIYFGILNHHALLHVKNGISENFMKYFDKSLRYVDQGQRKVVMAFQKYSMNEWEEDQGLRGGRLRHYEIKIDYYESKDDQLVYLYTDHKKVDSLSNNRDYNISKFTDQFFKVSLAKLDEFLRSKPNVETNREEKGVISKVKIEDSQPITSSYDTTTTKLETDYVKIEPKGIPKVHFILGFESFKGTSANGFRFRYYGFKREWDSLKWVGVFTIDIEGTSLNRNFSDDNSIFSVHYSYFALGIGGIKPLNTFFFLELSSKFAFGNEKIYFDPFYRHYKKNPLLGMQFNQRIHFMIGKGFGLVLNAGMYENFYPTTDYLKSDFGFTVGGGIKF